MHYRITIGLTSDKSCIIPKMAAYWQYSPSVYNEHANNALTRYEYLFFPPHQLLCIRSTIYYYIYALRHQNQVNRSQIMHKTMNGCIMAVWRRKGLNTSNWSCWSCWNCWSFWHKCLLLKKSLLIKVSTTHQHPRQQNLLDVEVQTHWFLIHICVM